MLQLAVFCSNWLFDAPIGCLMLEIDCLMLPGTINACLALVACRMAAARIRSIGVFHQKVLVDTTASILTHTCDGYDQ